jgi:hypothetical protein
VGCPGGRRRAAELAAVMRRVLDGFPSGSVSTNRLAGRAPIRTRGRLLGHGLAVPAFAGCGGEEDSPFVGMLRIEPMDLSHGRGALGVGFAFR